MNRPLDHQPQPANVERLLGRLRETVNLLDDAISPSSPGVSAAEPVGAADDEEAVEGEVQLVRRAAAIYRMRRTRDRLFGADFFGEAAWDMLLDLYVREATDKRTFVSSACLGAAVPATTALRHLGGLEAAGLVERRPDPLDGRRAYLKLTPSAIEHMKAVLRQASPPGEP